MDLCLYNDAMRHLLPRSRFASFRPATQLNEATLNPQASASTKHSFGKRRTLESSVGILPQ
jgi:hypothetical protein